VQTNKLFDKTYRKTKRSKYFIYYTPYRIIQVIQDLTSVMSFQFTRSHDQ